MKKGMIFYGLLSVVAAMGLLLGGSSAYAETTSLTRLLGLGQSLECSYQKTDEDGTQSGTFYVADQKMRGEIQVSSPDGTYPMNMLREGDWQYMWGGPLGESQGMKMQASAASSGRSPHAQHGPNADEEMDYQCKPWPVDASKFALPENVEFMEMGQMVPGMGAMAGSGMDMRAIQCGACEQAPEEDRAQCRQMMGC